MKIILPLLFMFSILFCRAQEGFERGYIITNKGDTVKGKIKDRKAEKSLAGWQKILFIESGATIKQKFTADELKGYTKKDTAFFETLPLGIEYKNYFVQKVENGPIILYAYVWAEETGDRVAGVLLMGGAIYGLYKSTRMKGQFYLQKANDKKSLMEWRSRDYILTAKYFFKDNTELVKQIEEGKYGYEDLQTIVQTYNIWKIRQ